MPPTVNANGGVRAVVLAPGDARAHGGEPKITLSVRQLTCCGDLLRAALFAAVRPALAA